MFYFSTGEIADILPTLEAAIQNDDIQWTFMDMIMYSVLIGLSVTITGLCLRTCCMLCSERIKKRKRQK